MPAPELSLGAWGLHVGAGSFWWEVQTLSSLPSTLGARSSTSQQLFCLPPHFSWCWTGDGVPPPSSQLKLAAGPGCSVHLGWLCLVQAPLYDLLTTDAL